MELIELALGVFAIGVTGLLLFGGGYLTYSLVKSSKMRRLHKQRMNEKREAMYYEEYIRKMDDELRQEIDAALSKEKNKDINYNKADNNKPNNYKVDNSYTINDSYNNKTTSDNTDFANIVKEKLHSVLDKIEAKHINKMEEMYKKWNSKYHFDDSGEKLAKVKQQIITNIDKARNNL